MKTIIISLCCIAYSLILHAQTEPYISFVHDNAGNRIQRKYINMGVSKLAQNTTTNETLTDVKGNITNQETLTKPVIDKLLSHDITIFPNPTQGKLVINITNLSSDVLALVSVYDISGKTFFSSHARDVSTEIDISDKPANVYFLKIEISGKNTVWEIIKQ